MPAAPPLPNPALPPRRSRLFALLAVPLGTLRDLALPPRCPGCGAVVSATLAGSIIVRRGYDAGFLTLAGIAAAGFVLYLFAMPETKGGHR